MAEAVASSRDVVICDTAGRLAIDDEMMDQIGRISDAIEPHYTFLVVDAMTGQDAVATAESFHAALELDGVILTKVDGDARGGAALSVKEVVGRPIGLLLHWREDRRVRAVPSRPGGQPDSRHGRCAHPGGEGRTGV